MARKIKNKGLSGGAYAGIVVGALVCCLLCFCMYQLIKNPELRPTRAKKVKHIRVKKKKHQGDDAEGMTEDQDQDDRTDVPDGDDNVVYVVTMCSDFDSTSHSSGAHHHHGNGGDGGGGGDNGGYDGGGDSGGGGDGGGGDGD